MIDMLDTLFNLLLIFFVVLGFLYLINPNGVSDFFNRLFGGQWFDVELKRAEDAIDIDIVARQEGDVEKAEERLPPMTNQERELAGIPVKTPELFLVQDNIYK